MHHDNIAFAHEGQQCVELWPLRIFARCLVGEYLVHLNLFQLTLRVLIEAADPDVADALTFQSSLPSEFCQVEIHDLSRHVSIN
jgi:hypothetical protein